MIQARSTGWRRLSWLWLAVLLLCGSGAGLRAVAARTAIRTGEHLTGDSFSYLLVATTIAEWASPPPRNPFPKSLRSGIFVRGPVYAAMLGLCGAAPRSCAEDILGSRPVPRCPVGAVVVVNVVLGFFTCLLTFAAGRWIGGAPTALLACALVAYSPDLINTTATVMTEPLRIPLVLVFLLSLSWLRRTSRVGAGIAAGGAATILAFSHSSMTLVPLFAMTWIWAFMRTMRWAALCSFLAPCLVGGLLWSVASWNQFGEVVMPGVGGKGFAGGGAWTAMIGSRPELDGKYTPVFDDDYILRPLPGRLLDRLNADGSDPAKPPMEPEIADWIRAHGIEKPIPDAVFWSVWRHRFTHDPLGFVGLTAKKAWRLVSTPQHYYILATTGPIPGSPVFHLAVLLFALVGLLRFANGPTFADRMLLALMPTYLVIVYSLTFPQARYWTPVLPVLSILAATALVCLWRMGEARLRR